ncbi:MAG: hypothetical protein GXY91_03465 [Clostridia bacterium]|nr:hypothetical protein [Clostridia bacterium]
MEKLSPARELIISFNATGAVRAARLGFVPVIVDVVDMSTSLEAALQQGAAFILGASPDKTRAPVQVNPYKIGLFAGEKARKLDTEIIIISEPRWGKRKEREKNCTLLRKGILEAGGRIEEIIPNLGAEIGKITGLKGKGVVCVSDTGGVAFDAAWQYQQDVVTGTIARTINLKGIQPAVIAAQRAIELARGRGIAVIAASSNSQEDILGANLIGQAIIDAGYLNL